MQKLVALTGAGISAESGIRTFRDANGLWEGYDVMEVASPQGWSANPRLVLDFYNQRRKQALDALPNAGHIALVDLEKHFDVTIITQNVDDLHERAGSTQVIHLHGELFKARSTIDEKLVYTMNHWELNLGDRCEKGSQLRPHIVWFGEMVPMMDAAIAITQQADILMVIGTSLAVYPAAGLVNYTKPDTSKFIIDPNIPDVPDLTDFYCIKQPATTGVPEATSHLLSKKD
ncbi:MAG: NAD-dependent deacylase [Cyclobacteriaceae bacterium]